MSFVTQIGINRSPGFRAPVLKTRRRRIIRKTRSISFFSLLDDNTRIGEFQQPPPGKRESNNTKSDTVEGRPSFIVYNKIRRSPLTGLSLPAVRLCVPYVEKSKLTNVNKKMKKMDGRSVETYTPFTSAGLRRV